ncbi:TMEM198/TM7SF3 family protein [Puniceicoccales bacterium CK1056]|uniref:TMEM198/TM7SF3 family protein n=1 Tax=Oceanipulchritudo coccoides TaxID=2706888 RepID=A0A6B2M187_9BACT|nr:DUF4203 domain-containing protein [Oceanipulchritudo coccoides]NDV61535.1 TMEM198/TM7SF3 family protein [Oceanipulchritudo coccoides]
MPQIPDYYLPLVYGGAGILGLISCFFGYRLFKLIVISILAVAGAATLAWAGFEYGEQPVLWSAGGLVIGAIVGGVLALFFYSLAVATMGALFAATSLMPWVQGFDIWMQWSILGVACILAAFIATMVTNLMIQLASAMLGASLLVLSVLYFTTGQTIHQAIQDGEDWTLILDMDLTVAGAALGIGLLGFLIQRRGAK